MSIPVELSDLAQAMARYRFAYLLTGTEHGAPHAIAVMPAVEGDTLVIEGVGRRTGRNLQARAEVALVWPPLQAQDYSLIVDGTASLAGGQIRIAPTRAVLHRPAPAPEPRPQGTCTSDCVELKL